MESVRFCQPDKEQIAAQGTTEAAVRTQIEMFQRGFPFTKLHRPCTVGDGIDIIPQPDTARFTTLYAEAASAGRWQKFVPAAGAASRMFQALLTIHHREELADISLSPDHTTPLDPDYQAFRQFSQGLRQFAFFDLLSATMTEQGQYLETLLERKQFKDVLTAVLTPSGLNYANLPKGLLIFHRYPERCRTALEEHLVEATTLVRDQHLTARVQFAVSPDHLHAMSRFVETIKPIYEQDGTQYDITWSTQRPSTDTIAVTLENQPFRDSQGKLLFRPGGHGALLDNLHDLNGDLLIIKNIDNVAPDHLKADTYLSTQLLGGYLIDIQQQLFAYLSQLAERQVDATQLQHIVSFAREKLSVIPLNPTSPYSHEAQTEALFNALNRPLRVCGVVPNTGEPGGGPFWVEDAEGRISRQIVETSQVDLADETQRALLTASTHFNPVQLVCGVRDYLGQPFDLPQFVDPNTGFISQKSYDGKPLKALERPGLWNGAMANWNTIFVEVPLRTFTPVKTILDLLRPEHQPKA